MTPQQRGTEFEVQFAKRLGLSRVPGSGNQWSAKLDVHGRGGRWSLKWTGKASFTIDRKLIQEAMEATSGLGGDGSLPLWAVHIDRLNVPGVGTLVIMREEDFVKLAAGEIKLASEVSKADARKRRAAVPQLLRDE